MSEKIIAALKQLDVGNDAHWTADGMPRIETVRLMASDFSLTREAVSVAIPGFTRDTPNPVQVAAIVATPIVPVTENGNATPATDQDGGVQTSEDQQEETEAQSSTAFAAAKQRMVEAEARKVAAAQEFDKAAKVVDSMIEAGESKPETLQEQLKRYYAQQERARYERAAKLKAIRDSGVKLEDILPKAANIDVAFQRRTKRGMQRPTNLLIPV